ncbi:EpsG family protein [Algoriphagus litoralis]|uniref:EpsG family protein n=1 Tax=Algoriphagus litoralis TaxID=2202829 RepID=UPI000DB9277F|nr:EpsG family protein [Algoriphagus litoralis]
MVFQSLIVYSILVAVMVAFAWLYSLQRSHQYAYFNTRVSNDSKRIYLILIICIFSLVMGLRYKVGADYLTYYEGYFYNIDVGKGEVFFVWIRELFNSLNFHFTIYFSFLAFLNITFFVLAFKRDAFVLPLLLFFIFANGDWLFWMNGIRQSIAMCIWIYALNFIEKEKLWMYFGFCLLSIGFHTSAIILIPLYFFLKNGKDYFRSIRIQLMLFLTAFVIQYLFNSFLARVAPVIEFYQSEISGGLYDYSMERFQEEASSTVGGSGIAYYFRLLLNTLVIFNSKKLKDYFYSKWFLIIYSLFFIGLLTENIFPVGSIVITRPFRYFFIFESIVYSYFLFYLFKNSLYTKGFAYVLILTFISIFYLNIITANVDSNIWYQFYFDR